MLKPRGDVDLIIILHAIVKLNWWDVSGFVDSSVWMWIFWVGVGLEGTYGCRCGILYVPIWG